MKYETWIKELEVWCMIYDARRLMSGRQRRKGKERKEKGCQPMSIQSHFLSSFLVPHSSFATTRSPTLSFHHHHTIHSFTPLIHFTTRLLPPGCQKEKIKIEIKSTFTLVLFLFLFLISISFMGFPGNGNGMNAVKWMNKRRMMRWWMGYWCIDVLMYDAYTHPPTRIHSPAR